MTARTTPQLFPTARTAPANPTYAYSKRGDEVLLVSNTKTARPGDEVTVRYPTRTVTRILISCMDPSLDKWMTVPRS